MSILNNILKACGTIIEGTGKTIVDCVEIFEQEKEDYKNSEQYLKDKAERERLQAEIKTNWNKIKENARDLKNTYKNNK